MHYGADMGQPPEDYAGMGAETVPHHAHPLTSAELLI